MVRWLLVSETLKEKTLFWGRFSIVFCHSAKVQAPTRSFIHLAFPGKDGWRPNHSLEISLSTPSSAQPVCLHLSPEWQVRLKWCHRAKTHSHDSHPCPPWHILQGALTWHTLILNSTKSQDRGKNNLTAPLLTHLSLLLLEQFLLKLLFLCNFY